MTSRREVGRDLSILVWRFADPMLAVSTAPFGGGLGRRGWVLNAQVPLTYDRTDPWRHVEELADAFGLDGPGVGMLTAADVKHACTAHDGGVVATATVGLSLPTWAAADEPVDAAAGPGTINIAAVLPERLVDAALVNAIATATEAKAQALWDSGIAATGTATDAVCLSCPATGERQVFGGPRSVVGAALARAVYRAVRDGCTTWSARHG